MFDHLAADRLASTKFAHSALPQFSHAARLRVVRSVDYADVARTTAEFQKMTADDQKSAVNIRYSNKLS